MSELDLTLLTDEERDIWEHANNRHMSAQRSKYFIGQVLTALIAARAENRRKDAVLTKLIDAAEQGRTLLRQMAEVSSLAARRDGHKRADAIDDVLKEAAALLQSEKESE